MEYKVIYNAERKILKEIVKIHYESLAYRSFITNFGEDFLFLIYLCMLEKKLGFLVCSSEGDNMTGFILACVDSSKLFSLIFRKFFLFLFIIIKGVIKSPGLIVKVLQTLSYENRAAPDIKPELVVIAVKENYRSKGIGRDLMTIMEDEFKKTGISAYKVTVHKEMLRANNFYLNNGMRLLKTFYLYGVPWNAYVKNVV